MPVMRDAQTGVVREVSDAWLKRWPGDYKPVKKTSVKKTEPVPEAEPKKTVAEDKEQDND